MATNKITPEGLAIGARVRVRLEDLGITQGELAAAVGMKQQGIASILAGQVRRPKKLWEIAAALKTSPEFLLNGQEREASKAVASAEAILDQFAFVDVYDQRASAGPGAYADENAEPMHQLAFRHDFLRSVTTATVNALFVLSADGDSMEPTIHASDAMLVDRRQTNPRKDGIYIVQWDGMLNVKRVTADSSSRTLTISSDNPRYQRMTGVNPDDVQVVGRVIWIGRRV